MSVRIAELQVEHHESGFAIGHVSPRLSWRYDSTDIENWKQTAYEVRITRNGQVEEYRIDSADSVLVPWPSSPLRSRDVAIVEVRSHGREVSSPWAKATIEAALLDREDWTCQMIAGPRQFIDRPKPPFRLCQTFELSSVPERARVYATAFGLYELYINGQRMGDQVLAPGWTSYKHRLIYQTYDIVPLLRSGTNTIGAYIGEGWYASRLGRPGKLNNFGDRLAFMCQLETDGKVLVQSDGSWVWMTGSVVKSEIYNGETFDSRIEDKWTGPGKGKVEVLPFPTAELLASDAPPVRRVMEVKPIEIITTPSGKQVLDFGQNLVGWIRVEEELQGQGEVVIRHAEVLERGELGVRPLRTAECIDRIILGGTTKGWEPRFTFHGFRYAEISNVGSLSLSSFTAIVISSDMRRTGHFSCSHDMLNKLHENVVWSMRGNFVSVPTDCPQRDERLGWTGDIQVFAPTANYLFDTTSFLASWLQDLSAETLRDFDSVVPTVVPFVFLHKPRPVAHAIWGDCSAITPYDVYISSGDRAVLEKQYDTMCAWLDRGVVRGPNGLWSQDAVQYGDWLDPRAPPQLPAHGQTDTHLAANAYLVYTTGIAARIASILGKPDKYSHEHDRLLKLFQQEYVTSRGRLVSDTQTAFALALVFDLLPREMRHQAAHRLAYLTEWGHFKITTGFAGTPIILRALADNDLLGHAYRCLQEKDNPSWLYPVGMGATTIWERWDSMLPDGSINPGQMTSFNHYALGAVAHFLHSTVGGLSPLDPGWATALVRPRPGGTVTSAKTRFDSPRGLYSIEWALEDETLQVSVTVPPNGQARVVLSGVDVLVGSGSRSYTVKWPSDPAWPPKGRPGPQSIPMPDEYVP